MKGKREILKEFLEWYEEAVDYLPSPPLDLIEAFMKENYNYPKISLPKPECPNGVENKDCKHPDKYIAGTQKKEVIYCPDCEDYL